jgi:hypothetical protein
MRSGGVFDRLPPLREGALDRTGDRGQPKAILMATGQLPTASQKSAPTGAALVSQRELLLPKLPAVFKDKSTIHGVTPARVSTSATNRASLHLVFRVTNTAMVGVDALKKTSRNVG